MTDRPDLAPPPPTAKEFTAEQLEAEAAWWAHEADRMWSHANSETAIVYTRTAAMLLYAASLTRREEELEATITDLRAKRDVSR